MAGAGVAKRTLRLGVAPQWLKLHCFALLETLVGPPRFALLEKLVGLPRFALLETSNPKHTQLGRSAACARDLGWGHNSGTLGLYGRALRVYAWIGNPPIAVDRLASSRSILAPLQKNPNRITKSLHLHDCLKLTYFSS
jgi:hypothetical protein